MDGIAAAVKAKQGIGDAAVSGSEKHLEIGEAVGGH